MTEAEQKEWLFKENIRIKEEREALENDKREFLKEQMDAALKLEQRKAFAEIEARRLEMERDLINKKIELLEKEYRRLADDKVAFEKLKARQRTVVNHVTYISGTDIFFKGVDNEIALKKRYRDLLKIFHPDNYCGDAEVIQNINKEYDSLRRKYCG